DYTIKRAGVFALELALPAGYRIETITGNGVLQWTEHGARPSLDAATLEAGAAASRRVVEVTFKQRISGACALRVELTQPFKALPAILAVEGVHPLGVQKLTGFISVSAEPGVAIKPAGFEGLTEIPAAAIPGNETATGASALAYKFI